MVTARERSSEALVKSVFLGWIPGKWLLMPETHNYKYSFYYLWKKQATSSPFTVESSLFGLQSAFCTCIAPSEELGCLVSWECSTKTLPCLCLGIWLSWLHSAAINHHAGCLQGWACGPFRYWGCLSWTIGYLVICQFFLLGKCWSRCSFLQ